MNTCADAIAQIRVELDAAETNEDYGDGDLGRSVAVGDLDRQRMASDYLPALLDIVELQGEYITFLEGEIGEQAPVLHVHGWTADPMKVEMGKHLRGGITEAFGALNSEIES